MFDLSLIENRLSAYLSDLNNLKKYSGITVEALKSD